MALSRLEVLDLLRGSGERSCRWRKLRWVLHGAILFGEGEGEWKSFWVIRFRWIGLRILEDEILIPFGLSLLYVVSKMLFG